MKKKILGLLIAIILVLPTVVAVANYTSTKNQPANSKNTVRMIVTDLNGVPHTYEKKADGDEADNLITLFCDINSAARGHKIPALPDAVASGKYFRVILSTVSKDDEYHYFMSANPSLCYISMPDGTICQPAEADVYKFLDTSLAESLYETSKPPKLTVSGEFAASPVSADWNYKNYQGEFVDAATITEREIKQSFDLSGGLSLAFDNEPDWCNVKITDADGAELFNDTADQLANMRIEDSMSVTVDITSKWYEVEERDYFGESTYSFEATITPPTTFHMPKATAENSRFVTISAKNVSDPSKITFKCEPDLGTRPTFYVDGKYAHGFLVIPNDAVAGEYKITLTCGAASQELVLTVDKKVYTPAQVKVADTLYNTCYSDSAVAEFDALVEKLASEVSEERYFDGAFGGFYDDRYNCAPISMGYGRVMTVNGDDSKTIFNNGVDFTVAAGTEVPAVSAGKVVYAGETAMTGKTVVIEHGYGLKTWYTNMSSVSVAVGDTVEKNGIVGVVGNSGFYHGTGTGVQISMSIGKDFVCPYQTWYNGDGGVVLQGVLDMPADKK